jgi:hypothetical protein
MPTGYLTIAAGRLWVRSFAGNSGGFAFDPATGKPLPPAIATGGLRGREIGVLRGRYLIYGGGEVYNDQSYRAAERSGGMALLELAADGTPQLPDLCFMGALNLPPAWNDSRLVTVGGGGSASGGQQQLQCWDVDRTIATFCDPAKRDDLTKTPDWRRRQLPRDLEDKERKASEVVRQWGPLPLDVNSLVMTPSSVVVAWGVKDPRVGGPPVNWFLGALKLDDGSTLWQTPLPAEPVTGAMTVDRDGRILLALRDGRVVCWAGPK